MSLSRIPGYSLSANLDRQGQDMRITSSGNVVTYWDVVNSRMGVNKVNPNQALDVAGNILLSNGHLYTSGNISYNLGSQTGWWRTALIQTVTAENVTGTLLSNAQPNITSTGNITLGNITISGGVLRVASIYADFIEQANSQAITTTSNIQISGDVVGYGVYNNINVQLISTGVTTGFYGNSTRIPQFEVNAEGRVVSAGNIILNQIGNISINDTAITSPRDFSVTTVGDANITLAASGNGVVKITGTDAVGFPVGDNTNRPLNPEVGYTRINSDRESYEYWSGTEWIAPGEVLLSSEVINPDGVSNVYVLGSNTSVDGVFVTINGTVQQPGYSYDIVNNNQIQFTEVPLTSDIVEVRFLSVSTLTVSSVRFGALTSVVLDSANVTITGNVQTNGFYNYKGNTFIPTVSTTTLDTYSATKYRSAKYVLQAVQASDVETFEVLVTHNGTSALSTTYGILTIGNTLGNISTSISSGNVIVSYNSLIANTYVTVSRDLYPL
jgi:hypothetical protein